ncbi:MAG: hypothetical protein WDO18_04755 [Acidobacteriota bacterium]
MKTILKTQDRGTLVMSLVICVVLPAVAGLWWRHSHPDFYRNGAFTHANTDGEVANN